MNNNCKKIIAWTEATKQDLIDTFPEVKDKVEVVSYAMEAPKQSKKKKAKDITLFFSGRHFYSKGGLHATEAMDRLTKKYPNVKGIINGVIPKEVEERYSSNKKLKFYGLMPYKDILKIYRDSDIFIYPGYSDSFGFCLIEAMAFGIPIITVDGYAREEIMSGAGIIIERPANLNIKKIDEKIVEDIVNETSILIEDKELLRKMSSECRSNVVDGKFSLKERNSRLSKIYKN
jgi:glycosyltransferase involved in cell wall biosynthesis